MKQGLFVTFEGIEGSGKSTQLRMAAEWLQNRGHRVFTTREPGGTTIGNEIRKILLSEKTKALLPVSEVALYLADRFQHIEEVIRPHLNEGDIVLCDRYHDSTVAYQGYARQLSTEWLETLWEGSQIALEPDVTLLFDLDPRIGIERSLLKLQKQEIDESRFENESLEFHERVRQGFLTLAKKYSGRYSVLDGSLSLETVQKEVQKILKEKLKA